MSRRLLRIALDDEPERGSRAGVSQRVLDQVLGDDGEHPGSKWELRFPVSGDVQLDVGPVGSAGKLGGHTLELGQSLRRPKCDHGTAALQLGQEEDVVDELCHLLDLGSNPVQHLCRIRPRLEQRQSPRKRRPQLVRDDCRESRAKLLVGFEGPGVAPVSVSFTRRSPHAHQQGTQANFIKRHY